MQLFESLEDRRLFAAVGGVNPGNGLAGSFNSGNLVATSSAGLTGNGSGTFAGPNVSEQARAGSRSDIVHFLLAASGIPKK